MYLYLKYTIKRVFLTTRNFGEIVKICILVRLNLMFQLHKTMSTLYNGARVQVRKHYQRIPCLPDYRNTVVGDTLPCVAESSNNSDWFAVAKHLSLVNFPNLPICQLFPLTIKPTIRCNYIILHCYLL